MMIKPILAITAFFIAGVTAVVFVSYFFPGVIMTDQEKLLAATMHSSPSHVFKEKRDKQTKSSTFFYHVEGGPNEYYKIEQIASAPELLIEYRNAIETASSDFLENRDGWKRSWPLVFTLHSEKGGSKLFKARVNLKSRPVFSIEPLMDALKPSPPPIGHTKKRHRIGYHSKMTKDDQK